MDIAPLIQDLNGRVIIPAISNNVYPMVDILIEIIFNNSIVKCWNFINVSSCASLFLNRAAALNLIKRNSSPFIGILRFFSKDDDEAVQAT